MVVRFLLGGCKNVKGLNYLKYRNRTYFSSIRKLFTIYGGLFTMVCKLQAFTSDN